MKLSSSEVLCLRPYGTFLSLRGKSPEDWLKLLEAYWAPRRRMLAAGDRRKSKPFPAQVEAKERLLSLWTESTGLHIMQRSSSSDRFWRLLLRHANKEDVANHEQRQPHDRRVDSEKRGPQEKTPNLTLLGLRVCFYLPSVRCTSKSKQNRTSWNLSAVP